MSTNFTCALSGETPISDPVALPTGQICSRSLLLKKLTETSNANPFDASMQVDETQLIELETTNEILPPRTSSKGSTNSIPSILNMLSGEYDALVLELFDTRKALEETRKELSHALYQNDAAVRVIARVVMERDMARRELANVAAAAADANVGNKRKRVDGGGTAADVDVVPQDEPATVATATAAASPPSMGIPQDIKDKFQAKWKDLSSTRKAKTKASESYPTPEEITSCAASSETSLQKKSYHKTTSKGISAMVGSIDNSIIVTSSKDKQLVYYNVDENKVSKAVGIKTVVSSTNLISCNAGTTAFVGQDNLLHVSLTHTDGTIDLLGGTVELEHVVGIAVHPTGEHVIVAQSDGSIHLFPIDVPSKLIQSPIVWNTNGSCTCIALHPDGLLLGIGREDGSIGIWDLNAENLATTFEATTTSPITAIDFSEKGVHIATANGEGTVTVWDLRKQKSIITMDAGENESSSSNSSIHCVSFCPIGKYLAYGTSAGNVVVTVVKDWNTKVVMKDGGSSKITGVVWGSGAKSLIVTGDSSRVVKCWGTQG